MIKGERFEIDLGSDDEGDIAATAPPLPGSFVNDVLERQPGAANPPKPPTLKNKTGFPEHRKRTVEKKSRFQRAAHASQDALKPSVKTPKIEVQDDDAKPGSLADEKRRIDEENRQRLADMSPAQLEEERQELLSSLSPAMIERLLKRSNIESGSNESSGWTTQSPPTTFDVERPKGTTSESVTFAEPATDHGETDTTNDDDEPQDIPHLDPLPHDSIHFPRPTQPPDLDPSSATFLQDLHEKYFPSLPADPSKLAWMQSSAPATPNNIYHPSASAFHAADLRFSFTGELLAPRTASLIPVTAGLHHHGDSPEAAGYTVAELAHLSRSTYAAQRCVAFQTLGRFLYRLGKGEFGDPGEPGEDVTGAEESFGELARGLWHAVEQERVIETLVLESEGQGVGEGRHVSARAYATEAVHLWRKGGGRRWKAG
ncbi:hypothetical protein LTR02_008564 [Friedmanniomyces endolithicus]|uniref:RNA polymerase II-associated protein 1 N-terminal domain-containing protein n=1 Tax=Rachicladosporium monterosium TaxID=1507873 RepID=A0ABR0L7V5_9PEZI|nr:hypothetical protein LTR94_001250 [Friedmanniomyces endolithicus]KAK5144856.1 hypothetical protein LTR32_003296 [Rachicladosporium monterosium]KAK0792716.1 hypothetical protein LTR38_009765 [Friedmanniomyces endolithicus]KAK0805003.1 hypothetical protein LTR75_007434 [Friedmanniomyces endolithicus]KAK0816581.1 hypothetical protein LTR59_000210 [Friedmanniomyces endolithicus]